MNEPQEMAWRGKDPRVPGKSATAWRATLPQRLNIAHLPWVNALLRSHWPQLIVRTLTLSGFVFTIAAGLVGPRVGSHNFAIVFVWIAWWTALKLAFIPLGGRAWCSICPIPLPGEWLQQGGILKAGLPVFGLNLHWPKLLKNSVLQSGGFLLIGLFSAVTLTDPRITAWVLLGLFGLAILLSLIFERRAFCSHVCPIGGFTGIYARIAPVEVRVVDTHVCAAHSEKTCYQNCPWGLYPVAFQDSAKCGLCMECLRACPQDNIAINFRPWGSDITTGLAKPQPTTRLDEAFLALVMLGTAIAFAAVFTGPWGSLKSAAYAIGSPSWMLYGMGFLALNLLVIPGCFALAAWSAKALSGQSGRGAGVYNRTSLRRAINRQSQALLPLGLLAWIAFTISFAFPKMDYVQTVLSDPLGWGWNLLGTPGEGLPIIAAGLSPVLQVAVLLAGLFWSARVSLQLAQGNGGPAIRQALPYLAFNVLFTLAMLWLLVG